MCTHSRIPYVLSHLFMTYSYAIRSQLSIAYFVSPEFRLRAWIPVGKRTFGQVTRVPRSLEGAPIVGLKLVEIGTRSFNENTRMVGAERR